MQVEVVDEAVPVWEVDKEPKQVLLLITDCETRWCSIYAMLVYYCKLRASIQQYNEKAIWNKYLADKVVTWDIWTADYPKIEQVLVMFLLSSCHAEKIKDIQMLLEASD